MKIRYYGHAGQTTGYGIAAEHMIRALLRVGIDVELRTLSADHDAVRSALADQPNPIADRLRRDDDLDANPDACIVHTLPSDCPRVVRAAQLTGDYPVVAYTTWEYANRAPPEILTPIGEVFNQLWTPSSYSLSGFARCGYDIPLYGVCKMPHAFDAAAPRGERSRIGDPNVYKFYYVGAWNNRKNPEGVIRAFAYEFRRSEPVALLLHVPGSDPNVVLRALCSTGLAQEDIPRIRAEHRFMSARDIELLHQGADCFVTATRGEGWNLPAFEAVLQGRLVIAPISQGHDEFLGDTNARRFSAYPMPACDDVITRKHPSTGQMVMQPYGVKGATRALWMEPDLLELAAQMRGAFEGRSEDIDVSQWNLNRYSYETVGAAAKEALEELR